MEASDYYAHSGQERNSQVPPRLVPAVVVLALATLWAQLNFFGYWATDVTGMAYTFGYCSIQLFRSLTPCPFVEQYSLVSSLISAGIFAASGTVVFWTSKSLFHRIGAITGVAVILAAIYSAAALGFSAYALRFLSPPGSWYITNATPDQGTRLALFIPFYLLFLIPILLLDLSTRNLAGRNRLLLLGLSIIIGPFAAFLDGRYALGIAETGPVALLFVIVPMVIGGVLGWVLLHRVANEIVLNLGVPLGSTHGGLVSKKQPVRQNYDSAE